MTELPTRFSNRQALIDHVRALAPWAEGPASPITAHRDSINDICDSFDPVAYAKTRNFGNGAITRLSPFVSHGMVSLNSLRNLALERAEMPKDAEKFIQELAWRHFWPKAVKDHPEWLWQDIEDYKTGFQPDDYAPDLPDDIATGRTGIACLDAFINELRQTGYIHNHCRMYLASYIVHFRRIKWQTGAAWFLQHLLDADIASNNLSWQWIASTFSNKPYIFNLENVDKYFGSQVDTSTAHNAALDASYEQLTLTLFPNRQQDHD